MDKLLTQKVFPTINNEDLLEFRIPPNQKGQLDLSNVMLHFVVTLPTPADKSVSLVPQNLLGPKQFSSVEVRVNGKAVTRRSCANEYFLSAYFNYLINFSLDYQTAALSTVGIFDYAQGATSVVETWPDSTKASFKNSRSNLGANQNTFEIVMPIDSTIFNTADLLPSQTALDLSFERVKASMSGLLMKQTAMVDSVLDLKDCYLMLPYKNDETMFQLERNAIQKPLKIKYDDFVIKRFNIPRGTSNVMMTFYQVHYLTNSFGEFKICNLILDHLKKVQLNSTITILPRSIFMLMGKRQMDILYQCHKHKCLCLLLNFYKQQISYRMVI